MPDRQQVADAEERVGTGEYDLVIMEDLSRHMRRIHAVLFCELCEDMGTRLVAINDDIDTCKEWRMHAFFAAMKHEQSNVDTSRRIKRSLRNRFAQGGVVRCPIFGYIKPPGAKSDGDLKKDPKAGPVFKEWFRRLEDGDSFAVIADWLNEKGVPVGPYCRAKKWDGWMVGRITRNPILKGVRVWNRLESKRVNRSGRHRSVKASPSGKCQSPCLRRKFLS